MVGVAIGERLAVSPVWLRGLLEEADYRSRVEVASRSASDYTPRLVRRHPAGAVTLEGGQIPWRR